MPSAGHPLPASGAPADPWPRRLITLLVVLFTLGVLVAWASVSYFDRNPAAVESFNPVDGWCDPATQGLGNHCFGDFQVPRLFLVQESIYGPDSVANPPNPYTPTAMAPHVLARALEWMGAGQRGSMAAYLLLLAAALLAPALWAILARRRGVRDWVPLLVIGVASGPFLTTLDRGNSAGFAVPLLLLFALYIRRHPEWVAPVAAVGAGLLRPQFILLALALLAFGRIKAATSAVAAWVVVSLTAFLLLPGGFAHNLATWWGDLAQFQASTDVTSDRYVNLSAAHALTTVGRWLADAPGAVGNVGTWISASVVDKPNGPGILLVAAVFITVLVAPSRRVLPLLVVLILVVPILTQAVSFGYYLMVALPLAAVILGPSGDVLGGAPGARESGGLFAGLEASARPLQIWAWLVIGAIGLSLVPILITGDLAQQSTLKGYMGLIWLAVVLVTLVLMWFTPRSLRAEHHST